MTGAGRAPRGSGRIGGFSDKRRQNLQPGDRLGFFMVEHSNDRTKPRVRCVPQSSPSTAPLPCPLCGTKRTLI